MRSLFKVERKHRQQQAEPVYFNWAENQYYTQREVTRKHGGRIPLDQYKIISRNEYNRRVNN